MRFFLGLGDEVGVLLALLVARERLLGDLGRRLDGDAARSLDGDDIGDALDGDAFGRGRRTRALRTRSAEASNANLLSAPPKVGGGFGGCEVPLSVVFPSLRAAGDSED